MIPNFFVQYIQSYKSIEFDKVHIVQQQLPFIYI